MSRTVEELLEFDRLKEILGRTTTCAPGRRAIQSLTPHEDVAALEAEFERVREAVSYLNLGSELGFGSLADPETWLRRLAVPGSVLSPAELLDVVSLMETAVAVRLTFKDSRERYPRLAECAAALAEFRSLASAIRRAVLPNCEISDDASPKLKQIRAHIHQARDKIQRSLEAILQGHGRPAGRDYITLRNDRFVVPVSARERRGVPGVVHGTSGTGQTVFVEPLEVIDLNNRFVQLGEDEVREIDRILEELTQRVAAEHSRLEGAAASMAHLDSVFARARFAREYDAVAPEFGAGDLLRLEAARNPVLEATLRPQGRNAVPLSLTLGDAATVLVISGPNTGGKTVALKTVGLAALAAQSAIPITAGRAEMPVFDRVLADIGDEQSIAADLSTFSAHILNLKSMLEVATPRSLILVDEMGTGTAPEEGAALAVALLDEFCSRRSLTLATTHHDRLKAYASTTTGILNASMEFDEENLRPTYRLRVGVPGTSSGIEIARRLGLPAHIIEQARAGLSPESREARDLIAYLHRSRDEMEATKQRVGLERAQLEKDRRELETDWVDRQKRRIAELERNFAETQKRLEGEVLLLAQDIRDRALRAQAEKQAGRRMGKITSESRAEADAAILQTLSDSQADLGVAVETTPKPVAPSKLSPGLRVHVKTWKQPVIFRSHDGRTAEVEAGPLRVKVPLEDITAIAHPQGAQPRSHLSAITVHTQRSDAPTADEINVIGCTVEQASERVDKFLDEAVLAGKPSVRVIHGHGTGALRRGLAQFLSAHPLVEKIHHEAEDRGGTAVTVAELKS
ncbi:MAG TPA: Smr/MutS family protein [Candidatus Acidoferrales bacterium]|nr:Smr/MutS family protein [Candidatus Acidoferrales bacterium]